MPAGTWVFGSVETDQFVPAGTWVFGLVEKEVLVLVGRVLCRLVGMGKLVIAEPKVLGPVERQPLEPDHGHGVLVIAEITSVVMHA